MASFTSQSPHVTPRETGYRAPATFSRSKTGRKCVYFDHRSTSDETLLISLPVTCQGCITASTAGGVGNSWLLWSKTSDLCSPHLKPLGANSALFSADCKTHAVFANVYSCRWIQGSFAVLLPIKMSLTQWIKGNLGDSRKSNAWGQAVVTGRMCRARHNLALQITAPLILFFFPQRFEILACLCNSYNYADPPWWCKNVQRNPYQKESSR